MVPVAGDMRLDNDEAAYIVTSRPSAPASHMKIEEQITLFPELPENERAAVEEYVVKHPEWKHALDEAKRWDELLREVRSNWGGQSLDDVLAYYVVVRRIDLERAPKDLKELIRQVEERIDGDPLMAVRVAEMDARLSSARAASPPTEQFERLTNRRREMASSSANLSIPYGGPPPRSRSATSASQRTAIEGNGHGAAWRNDGSSLWRALAAVIAAVALYGILYAAGELGRPLHERLANFDDDELTIEGFENVRGSEASEDRISSIELYLHALEQLRGAQNSFIGLFPTFDEYRLDSAATILNEVVRLEPPESFLSGEASFLLGKAELARGNIDAASHAFSHVVATGGRRAPEARRILAELGS